MDITIGARWENFVDEIVSAGRYGSANEVMLAGLRLVEEREAKQQALRDILNASIERGGSHSAADVRKYVREDLDAWEREQRG